MGDDAGGKNQSCFLRGGINRPQQTASRKPRPSRVRINSDLPHSRQVDHHAAIAGAKAGKAMSSTAYGGQNSDFSGGADSGLHIAYIYAACDQAGRASYHAVPNAACVLIAALAGEQQIAFKSSMERRVDLLTGADHLVPPCRKTALSN